MNNIASSKHVDKIAVLYSAEQKQYHIEPFICTLTMNIAHLKINTSSTYEIIGLFDTDE